MEVSNAFHITFIDREVVDQTRHCSKNCADNAALYAVSRDRLPDGITTHNVHHVANQREDPQSDWKSYQHRMQGVFLDTCRG